MLNWIINLINTTYITVIHSIRIVIESIILFKCKLYLNLYTQIHNIWLTYVHIHLNYLTTFKIKLLNTVFTNTYVIKLITYIQNTLTDWNFSTIKHLNNILFSINIELIISLLLFIKIIHYITSQSRYNSTKAVILSLILAYITLNSLNLTFWVFFITLAELTSVYLVSLILINYSNFKKINTKVNYIVLFLILLLINESVNYSWFNLFININNGLSQLTLLKNTILNVYNLLIIATLIWILTTLLLINIIINLIKIKHTNIMDFIYKIKILINTTNESLNQYTKDFIIKWTQK